MTIIFSQCILYLLKEGSLSVITFLINENIQASMVEAIEVTRLMFSSSVTQVEVTSWCFLLFFFLNSMTLEF